MRIIGGRFAGRVLSPPFKSSTTRPITDKAKEAIYNILSNYLSWEGLHALDLFSGAGSHTFELLSRGAENIVSIEKDAAWIKYIRTTARELEIENQIHLIQGDVYKFLNASSSMYDLIIADPPYDDYRIPQLPEIILERRNLLNPAGIFVLEHGREHNFEYYDRCFEMRQYGHSYFSFFR